MASSSPGTSDLGAAHACAIGLSPLVPSNTIEAEEKIQKQFYGVLQEFNTNPVLRMQMNTTLDIRLSKLKFTYLEGSQMVDGILTCKSRDEIQKVKQRIRDNRLADFLTNYLDTIGLNIELGLTIKEKVEVIVFEIEDETNKTKSSTNTSKIVDGLKETQIEDTNVNNKTVSKEIVGEKVVPFLFRVFVPIDVHKINEVRVNWNGKCFAATNIPETQIWTVTFDSIDKKRELQMEVSFIKSSGLPFFKTYSEVVLRSPIIEYCIGNSIFHLVFQIENQDEEIYEKAFVEFCINILYLETFNDKKFAFLQLEAMNSMVTNLCVNFKSVRREKVRDVLKDIIKSLPNGLHARNIPTFCYIVYELVSGCSANSFLYREVFDEKLAKHLMDQFKWLKFDEECFKHMGAIGTVLEEVFVSAYGKEACVIRFVEKTLSYLNGEYFTALIQRSIGKNYFGMPLYVESEHFQTDDALLKILDAFGVTLVDKILRHLPHSCSFEAYISVMRVLLIHTEKKPGVHEKLTDSCKQKCTQLIVQETKTGNLKSILSFWNAIQNLQPATYDTLLKVIENGILECVGNESKLANFDQRAEFMHTVIEGPMFCSLEGKFELLKCLAKAKKNLRTSVVELLADEKFTALPDDTYAQIVLMWLKNSLQLDKKRYNPEERIVKAYDYLCQLMKLIPLQTIKNLHDDIDDMVFKTIEQYSIRELMRAVAQIENKEEQQKLFQNHMSKILHGKHSKKSPKDIIQDICGTEHLRIRSRLTANILKDIIDLLGISGDEEPSYLFEKTLEHATFWAEIFNAQGFDTYLQVVQRHKPCLKVLDAIAKFRKVVQSKQLCYSQVEKLKIRENEMLQLLSCTLDSSKAELKQKVQNSWMKCSKILYSYLENINLIREIFHTLKARLIMENAPSIIAETLDFFGQIQTTIHEDQVLIADIVHDEKMGKNVQDISEYCALLIKPVRSQVFWNILNDEFRQRKVNEGSDNVSDNYDDPFDGISLPDLFGEEYETVISHVFTASSTLTFVRDLNNTCLEKYRQVWFPYFKQENRPLEDFKKTFARIKTKEDMEKEITTAEVFCNDKSPPRLRDTLMKFADLMSYGKTVEAVKISLKIFKFKTNEDAYTDIVNSFYMLFRVKKGKDSDLKNMSTKDMEVVFDRVESIRQFISIEVTEILEVLKQATLLLQFLEEVVEEDIRNLIDAVEEHSEQFVSESTVSDLIEVKRFFYPILKRTYGDKLTDFFALLQKQLKSGFNNIPAKINDCMENLHTLRALYKNVANRGERTKEIIDSIVDRGKFCFRMKRTTCEVIVKYKQDKKNVSHNSADLSDFRSRALLLMNAEDREKTRQKTRKRKEDLEKFLLLVDTAFQISSMCLQLKKTGHFDYARYDQTFDLKELTSASKKLKNEYEEWVQTLATCRMKYYYMNFIYPSQLQQLFEYLCRNSNDEHTILTCLQFIDCSFEKVSALKDIYQSLPTASNNREILHNISITLQDIFKTFSPVRRPLSVSSKKAKITDIVQPGVPYIAALDIESPLVIRTMFALYSNTTNLLPEANQVLLCREETTSDEISLFLRRCTGKPTTIEERRLYCISNVEMLSNDVQTQFVEKLLQLASGEFLLSVICCGHSHHPFLDQFSDRLSHPTPMTEASLQDCLRKQWPNILIVSSDVPGLGKTEMIRRKAREDGMSIATIHLSGKINLESVIQNLHSLKLKSYHVLHVDVGITNTPSELDAALFQLIVLGHLSTGSIAYTLSTKHVYIEISNTVCQTLSNSLPTTTCFHRVNLDWNNYDDMKVSMEVNSPVQVVCQYLMALEKGTLDRNDIYFTGSNRAKPLKPDECISLLGKWFSSAGDMSYTLLQTFVNVLSDQLKKMSASVFFRTSSISAMIGEQTMPTVKSNLVKALVNASQEFACRSVQSCRSLQETSLLASHKKESITDANSAEELAQRVAGMVRWEDSNHLMILFHQNVQTVSALFRDGAKIPPAIKTLFVSQMKKNLDDFKSKTQRELQEILQMLTRNKPKKLLDNFLDELALEYALTPDNLLKMILISLRINSCIPVVIMGETGCGKTSLVRYLAEICEIQFILMSIHAGIEEKHIIQKVHEVNDKAIQNLNESYWLFLDEINTCDHLGIINSIICHRFLQGEILAPNVTVLAACNPYRLRAKSTILTAGLQGKVKTDELSRLVYRVHPLPEALIDFVWDYGSLNEKDEKLYISKMVITVFSGHFSSDIYETTLTELLAMSQKLVRVMEATDSCVSLRDVDRCRKLVLWFLQFLPKKKTKTAYNYGIEMKAVVLALAVSYHSRFADVETRTMFREQVAQIISKNQHRPITADTILEIIRDEQNDIINRMVLPSGIAKNMALQENVFVVLVCILNKIPIFLVGKPGCSKSLSIQLIRSNLRGKDSKDELFQSMPQLFCVSFQGSESSTSDGIIKVFEKAENYQKHNEKDVISVVILDEIGLAEVSRFNPLKVLHALLEPGSRQNPNVAVVGISNWALDAAKMNRAVHLSRPDMNVEELKYTGYSIISAMVENDENDWDNEDANNRTSIVESLKNVFAEIAVAYFRYVSDRQKFPNFHGLRDYYSLIKYIGRCIDNMAHGIDEFENEVIQKGIARNFGGLPTEMVGIIGVFQESFPDLKYKNIPVTELIKDNLMDGLCRHLMLITNGDAVISVLESHLNETQRPFEIIFGSHFDDDLSDDYNYRILSRIILCMEQGLVLILKGLESIYGSLYDMLNQNYTIVGNKKNCRIALGHYSNPMCHVNDSFKCIVLVEETKLDFSDPPFLNRFEKQQFKFSDLVENENFRAVIEEIAELCEDLCRIEGCMFIPENEIPSYSRDLLVSLILYLKKLDPSNQLDKNVYLNNAIKTLLWVIPTEVMVRARESRLHDINADQVEKITEYYMGLPIHEGLASCLNKLLFDRNTLNDEQVLQKTNGELLLCYTYSNIHCNIKSFVNAETHQVDRLASFKSEKQLTNRMEEFFNSEKNVLLLQCSATNDSPHLLLTKVIIENIRRKSDLSQKHVCMIIHRDRNVTHDHQYVPINYLSGWRIIFLDSLEKPTTPFSHFLELSKHEIVQERRPLKDYIVENVFWALTRIKFTTQNNSIENQQRMMDQIRNNDVAVSVIEELIMNWIEDQTSENPGQWCVDVAKNSHELYRSGSLVSALENSIHEVIKTPLAMYLYKMLELQILSPVFVIDGSSERVKVWKDIVLSKTYINISDMPPITGPECYSCSAPFLCLKMPLSRMVMDKINAQKDDFIEIVRKIRIQNDIDPDEDVPIELFEKTVTECIDIICHDVDDIYNVQYEGSMEDYVHDFCSVHSLGLVRIHDETKARNIFQWALHHFVPNLDFEHQDITQIMSFVHAAWWLNGQVISSICKLIEHSELFIDIFGYKQVLNSSASKEEKLDDNWSNLNISIMSRTELVDNICKGLLPTEGSSNFDEWIRKVDAIIPIAKEVSYESALMPSLQICQEVVRVLSSVEQLDSEPVCMLGDLFRENNGQINSSSVFSLMISLLRGIQEENKKYVFNLQKLYCSYVIRCLHAHPDDTEVLIAALNIVAANESLDPHLSYFGKCLQFALMLDNMDNENLIRDIIIDEIEEIPPFIECLDGYLVGLDISDANASVLPCLLTDVIQKSCLHLILQPNTLLQIESSSDVTIRCLLAADDIVREKSISFKYIAAVAFLRGFLEAFADCLQKPGFDLSEMSIVCQHVNILLSNKWKAMDEFFNPKLIYLLKLFAEHSGIECISKCCKRVENILSVFESVQWNMNYLESTLVLNPLSLHIESEKREYLLLHANSVLEKENFFENILNCKEIDNITLLGVLSQRFYMRRYLKELNDNETRIGMEISRMIMKSNRSDKIKHICRYLLCEEFGHELFVLSEASESPFVQVISVILHLCCLISTTASEDSIWHSCLFCPTESSQELLPCTKTPYVTKAEDMVIRVLTDSVVIGSMGFYLITGDALLSSNKFTTDPSKYFQNDLLTNFSNLERLLQLNSSDLCLLIHWVILKCENLITKEMLVHSSSIEVKNAEKKLCEVIKNILENRWQIIHDIKRSICEEENETSLIEAYVDEIEETTTGNSMDRILLDLLRVSQMPTKEIFKDQLSLQSEDHAFLHLIFCNTRRLSAPKFVTSLLRWNVSVITSASYKFRKVDFKDLTVMKFFSQEVDDMRRNILKKHFDHFKKSWNEIREAFGEVLNSEVTKKMENMTTLVKMEACTVMNDDSTLLLLLKELVNIHNHFLIQSSEIIGNKKEELLSLPLLDVRTNDVIAFEWKDDWLRFSQCETQCGLGKKVYFDFEKIEDEIKKEILYGKIKIEFPASFPKPVFTDDLFQNSVELLSEIEARIPQQHLTTEIRKSVELKVDRDASFVTDLLSHLGMVLSLLKKTGGDNSQPLIEYLEKWQSVTGMNSNIFKRILPEPIDSVKLGHAVTLYKWLEELNGESLVETLDEAYHKTIPTEANDVLQKIKKAHIIHLEKLQHPLLVFVHRGLALKKSNISTDHALVEYISASSLWWKEDFYKESVVAGPDKSAIPLTDILSPLILIEHVCETVQFVRDAVMEAKEVDVRIAMITTDFQKTKKSQPVTSSRKSKARKLMKM